MSFAEFKLVDYIVAVEHYGHDKDNKCTGDHSAERAKG